MAAVSRDGMAAVIRSVEVTSVGLLLARLPLIPFRAIDLDEYEHAHAAWSVAHGLLPYRDFFEHHPPAVYLLFAPIFAGSRPAIDPVHALQAIEAARGAMWLFAIASVAIVYDLAEVLHNRLAAAIAALLLATSIQFLMSTLEFRPDVAAVFLLLVCISLLLDRSPARLPISQEPRLVMAGVAFGTALLFTQKAIFAAPGIGLALLLTRKLRPAMVFAIGAVLPIAITLLWFRRQGALAPLWYYTVTFNARLNADGFSPWPRLLSNLIQQPAIYLLGLGALVLTLEVNLAEFLGGTRWRTAITARDPSRLDNETRPHSEHAHRLAAAALRLVPPIHLAKRSPKHRFAPHPFAFLGCHPAIIVLPALSLIAGIFIIGRSYDQYYALLLPLLAILGGSLAVDLLETLRQRPAIVLGVVMAATVEIHQVTFIRSVKPIDPQVEELTYATTHLNQTDSYIGGSPGSALFRPHAWFYFFLTGAFASDRDWAELTDAIQSGRLQPRIVIRDRYLEQRAPAALLAYLDAHYRQAVGDIYLRQSE